jgi:hypothetical protein
VGSCGVRATDGPPTASLRVGGHAWDTAEHPVLQRPPGKLARLPVQLWAGQSMVVVARDRHGEAPGVTGRQAWRTPCHAVPQRDGRSCLAGVGFLGGTDHGQTPQDSDLPLVCGLVVTALPKYIGEPQRRREEHARGVPWLSG